MDPVKSEKDNSFSSVEGKSNLTPTIIFGVLVPIFIFLFFISLIVGAVVSYNQRGQIDKLRQEVRVDMDNLREELLQQKKTEEDMEKKACQGVYRDGICIKYTCVDTDEKEKPEDIYIKGFVTYIDADGEEESVYDECSLSGNQVSEVSCTGEFLGTGSISIKKELFDCPLGCTDGACVR